MKNFGGFLSRLPSLAAAIGFTSAVGLASGGVSAQTTKPTIVLVHGAWADASSWNGVIDLLLKEGYTVKGPPNTLRGLAQDSAVISTYLKTIPGPVVLVGHSYGGSVISVASANSPNVKALVFVDALVPDAGESVQSELASAPPSPPDFTIAVPFAPSLGNGADLYVNPKYFGLVFASAESVRCQCVDGHRSGSCRMEDDSLLVRHRGCRQGHSTRLQLKFATRAKSKVYHVPGGDHPSMIGHPEVTVTAINAAANAVSH
jgi:pimeloyl-ACP methyl ester carboxylesterase